jgi:hypothetical protein
MGNQMIQYMYCRHLQMLVQNSEIGGFSLPEFGLLSADFELEGRVLHIRDGHRHSMSNIAYQLNQGIYDSLLFEGFVARLEYYPNRDLCSSFFRSELKVDRALQGPNHITINVRGNEILRAMHADYYPVEISFFEHVASTTGLEPVIMGQLGDDAYSVEIRRRFAGCKFLPSQSPIQDFEFVRNSTNVALGVSTFSWLATWLSATTENIHLPIKGLLNPRQRPDVDLLPTNDERYHFYEFPVVKWEATAAQYASLLTTDKQFSAISAADVRKIIP